MPDIAAKICGLKTLEQIDVAASSGARYIGFVFFEKSPRHLTLDEARPLATAVPAGVAKVALVVNPEDAALDRLLEAVPIDMLQLHGAETPERVAEIRSRSGLPVMKALGIAGQEDLDKVHAYAGVADQVLVDAKPPKGGERPGGNGLAFDWTLLQSMDWPLPWLLAGGLTPDNVADAIRLTGASQVDVSSGVESAPGQKDLKAIKRFLDATRPQEALAT